MTYMHRRLLRLGGSFLSAIILLPVLNGCALFHKPPPPAPPAVAADMSSFVGTALSGPIAESLPSVSSSEALRIDVRWVALAKLPTDVLAPLDAQSHLTISPLAAGPVLTVGRLTRQVRIGTDESAQSFANSIQGARSGQSIDVAHQSGAVVPGSTLQLSAAEPGPQRGRKVSVAFSRPAADSTLIAIGVADRIDVSDPDEPEGSRPTTAPAPVFGQETAILRDIPIKSESQLAVIFPFRFGDKRWSALAALIDVRAANDDPSDAQILAQLSAELKTSSGNAKAAAASVPGDSPALRSAIESLGRSNQKKQIRPGLLFLATSTGADIASDFILAADNPMLSRLGDLITAYSQSQTLLTSQHLEWFLDRTALTLMSKQSDENPLPPELASVLVLHAGEVGRHADVIEDILKTVGSPEDLQKRLIAENYIALEDNSPGARVRAYDWLKSRGKAPPDFDPLADPKSRRAAIDKALAAGGGAP